MKSNIFFILFIVLFLSGCSTTGSNYRVASMDSWFNKELQKPTIRKIGKWKNPDISKEPEFQDNLSESPIECRVPETEQVLFVYSIEVCEKLVRMKKNEINQRAFRELFPENSPKEENLVTGPRMSLKGYCDGLRYSSPLDWAQNPGCCAMNTGYCLMIKSSARTSKNW